MNALILELLNWISSRTRTYEETMDAWRSNCPRHSVWEDASIDGLVEVEGGRVSLTRAGLALLEAGQAGSTADRNLAKSAPLS